MSHFTDGWTVKSSPQASNPEQQNAA